MRLRDAPDSAQRVVVDAGSSLEGRQVRELHREREVWVGIVVRDGRAVPVRPETVLEAGDELLLITDPAGAPDEGPLEPDGDREGGTPTA